MTVALLDENGITALRTALACYTVESVQGLLGLPGRSALERGDLAGVSRILRADHSRPGTLVRLFMLGAAVDDADARTALAPLRLDVAEATGLVERSAGSVRARLDIRPYAQDGAPPNGHLDAAGDADPGTGPWWVVSDLGADVRGGPLSADHVLGIGSASLTLAQSTPRRPVQHSLDIGTGCGVQALHLSSHSARVTATDVSARALRLAATTAALSGLTWDLRTGSLLDPVDGERFDLIVANPPFVISDGGVSHDYRDSGLSGDQLCRDLVRRLPSALSGDGTAQLLANWVLPADGSGSERLAGWFDGGGCDAWVWQREVAEPGEYVSLWLRDAGEVPGSDRWNARYDAWLEWFETTGVVAVGMGLITMWHNDAASPTVVVEDVPQAVEQPAGRHIGTWVERQRMLARLDDTQLMEMVFTAAPDLVLDRCELLGHGSGWMSATSRLRQSHAMRWSVDTDDAIAALVAGCDGRTPLRTPVAVLAGALQASAQDVARAAAPVVRDLIGRGFLIPAAPGGGS